MQTTDLHGNGGNALAFNAQNADLVRPGTALPAWPTSLRSAGSACAGGRSSAARARGLRIRPLLRAVGEFTLGPGTPLEADVKEMIAGQLGNAAARFAAISDQGDRAWGG